MTDRAREIAQLGDMTAKVAAKLKARAGIFRVSGNINYHDEDAAVDELAVEALSRAVDESCDHYKMVSGNKDGPWTCEKCGAVDPPRPKWERRAVDEPTPSKPLCPMCDDDGVVQDGEGNDRRCPCQEDELGDGSDFGVTGEWWGRAVDEPTEADVERVARALCEARGEEPEGCQVRFVDGEAHSATFLDIARHDARAAIAAMRAAQGERE